jgi:hypothetical protein
VGSCGTFRIYKGRSFLDSEGIKWMEHKADNPHPPGAKVKNGGAIPPSPNMSSWQRDFNELNIGISLPLPYFKEV